MTSGFGITFCGAADTVTGSRHLVEVDGQRLLLDCGLFQGFKTLRLRNWAQFPVPPESIDAVVLSHAHLDHCGYLPVLIRQGFKGPVFCSPATKDLAELVLLDSARLLEEEAEHANRNGYSKHQPALALYTVEDVHQCMKHFKPIAWDTPHRLGATEITLARAGHLLGAAIISLTNKGRKLVFSGDLGREDDILMVPPDSVTSADILLIESTYGNRAHPPENVEEELATVIRETAARGGTTLIPTFALGRAQVLLLILSRLLKQEAIPRLPVFLDSPMAEKATEIHRRHGDQLRVSEAEIEALYATARFVSSPEESRQLSSQRIPCVILAGSGMATGGRILHHLKSYGPDPRNAIVFPGFQVPGTRGARLLAGEKSVKIHGVEVPIRAKVSYFEGFSGHADAGEILSWLRKMPLAPKMTYVVHGERDAADTMRLAISRELAWPVTTVEHLQSVTL